MRGDKTLISHLNKVLGNELVAINQYFCMPKCTKTGGLVS
jgi:Bacterioferritin (cytochrome b1)